MQNKVKERNIKVASLSRQLDEERDEKMQLLEEVATKEEEWEARKKLWSNENKELRTQLGELIDRAKETIRSVSERSKVEQNSSLLQLAYQKSLETCKRYESENNILKEELRKLSLSNFIQSEKMHYDSNTSVYSSNTTEDDAGYSSNKNTLETQTENIVEINDMQGVLATSIDNANDNNIDKSIEKDKYALCSKLCYGDITTLGKSIKNSNSNQQLVEYETNETDLNADQNVTSQYNENYTSTILRLKNLLEEEKRKLFGLQKQLDKTSNRRRNFEDTIRVNELEVENEMLRSDYDLLRKSIRQGAQLEELENQHKSLHDEMKRRREECIQLKILLHQYAFTLKDNKADSNVVQNYELSHLRDNELVEAFEAQKVVNRQLESELQALTTENNAHLADLAQQIDELRKENDELYNILHVNMDKVEEYNELQAKSSHLTNGVDNSLDLQQSNMYLRHELHKTMQQYARVQEELNLFMAKYENMHKRSDLLALKLYQNTVASRSSVNGNDNNIVKDSSSNLTIAADLLDDLGYVDNSGSCDENDMQQNQELRQVQTEHHLSANNEVPNCSCSLGKIEGTSTKVTEYQGENLSISRITLIY